MRFSSLVGVVAFVTIAGAQQQTTTPPQSRRVYYEKDADLVSRLKADDKNLEITRLGSIPFLFLPDDMSETEFNTRSADVVAIVRVVNKVSQLTPQGDWLRSTISAQVLAVLKDTSDKLRVGETIALAEDGGELLVGDQRIRAVHSWVRPIVEAREYVIFAVRTPDGLRVNPSASQEVAGSQLVTLLRKHDNENPVHTSQSLSETITEIQSKAHLPRAGHR